MASRNLTVSIIGDSKSFERALTRSTTSANRFAAGMQKVQGRVSGGLLGGRLGGGTAAFAGGAGITLALKDVLAAARDAEVGLAQTRAAVEQAGLAWAKNAKRIDAGAQAISRAAALDDEEVLRSFQTFVRGQGDVEKALRLSELAANVARGRYISLEQATQLVNKAALGQVGALRRVGIDVDKNATSVELLDTLWRKFGGSAEAHANTAQGAIDRMNVSLENSKELFGGPLSKAVALFAGNIAAAAESANALAVNLGKIPGVDKLGFLEKLIPRPGLESLPFVGPPLKLGRALFGDDSGGAGGEPGASSGGAHNRGLGEADRQLKERARIAKAVQASLKQMNQVFATVNKEIAKAEAVAGGQEKFATLFESLELNLDRAAATRGSSDDLAVLAQMEQAIQARIRVEGKTTELARRLFEVRQRAAGVRGEAGQQAFQELIESLSLQLDKAGLTARLSDDLRVLGKLEAAIVKQIAAEGRTTELARKLFEARQQIAQARKNQRDAARAATQAAQFKALGLSATGDKPIPTISNLTKQLDQLDVKVTGGKNQKILNAIRKVLLDPVHKATEETRQAIRDMFGVMRGELDSGLKGPLTKTSGLNTKKIIEGLGLDADTAAQIRARLSGFNTAGQALATASNFAPVGAMAGAGAGMIQVESTIMLDGAAVGLAVTRHQQKTSRRNPRQKRGPNRIGA